MIRSWFLLFVSILLLLAGAAVLFGPRHDSESEQAFLATINRECAPWDGAAFTVSIPIEEELINISIYQPPNIQHGVTFTFPDESMQKGNAMLLLPTGIPETLLGKVSFKRVEQGTAVEGEFSLSSETGRQFKGRFIAVWENEIVYCG